MIPGKSIKVRSGASLEYTVSLIGLSTIPLLFPATLSVNSSILDRTLSKSVYFVSGYSENTPYGLWFGSSTCTSLNSSGVLVHIPAFLGKKSIPTIDSSKELFPADWSPK